MPNKRSFYDKCVMSQELTRKQRRRLALDLKFNPGLKWKLRRDKENYQASVRLYVARLVVRADVLDYDIALAVALCA